MRSLDYLNCSVLKEIIDLKNIFINGFTKALKSFPHEVDQRQNWKESIKLTIDNFLQESNLISIEDKKILFDTGILKNTQDFFKMAQNFNDKISRSDIGQAVRNVWIMNIIQLLLEIKPEVTPAVFGYSMLYPYTDNYLDNPNITNEEKIIISDRFEKKLEESHIKPNNSYEESLFKLVDNIEEQYNRLEYPQVFQSLLSIHKAQKKSLLQQGRLSCPYEIDILGLSIEKGGASVLADAYLVNGKLKPEEASFFFGYGVILQICDNLENIKELIRKNLLMLIFFSIAKNRKLYNQKYLKKVEEYFPYRTKYMINFYNKLIKKYSNIDKSYGGVSIEEIIIFALES